jgi:nucleoid-associated protein YgaU
MSQKKGGFRLFRRKEEEDKKEEVKKEVSQESRERERKKIDAEIRARHEAEMAVAKAKREAAVTKHVVVSGETLSGIAKKYYDDAGKYLKIYEANKEVIGGDPNLIQPGMELVIPDL